MTEKFLQYLTYEKRFSQHTLLAYTNDLKQFNTFLQEIDSLILSPLEIRHTHVRSWIVALMEEKVTPRSINRKLSTLKSYFKFLKTRGFITENPMLKVIAPKVGKRLPQYVQEPNMEQLLERIDFGTDYTGVRNELIINILYATGMRKSELIGLKMSDIDHSARLVKVLGKGNKERLVPLIPKVYTLIEAFKLVRQAAFPDSSNTSLLLTDKGESLYPKLVYTIVNKYLSYVTTIEQRSPHVLRHTFATHLSEHGADIKAIKELLGHSSLAATQVYTHNSMDRLRQVYEQAFPRAQEIESV